jgi:hypothetical protein
MFTSAVNTVNAAGPAGKTSSSANSSVNKVQSVPREFYVPQGDAGANVAPSSVKVPQASSKKNKFP